MLSIYVESLIRASLDEVWAHTQQPFLHQRWDLRFSKIDYLPRESEQDPQRFRYTTRIGFGIAVSGEGESVGQRDAADGSRTSALRFGSTSPLSLIREGSGYWRYVPTEDGVRFLTSYDYRTRYGFAGALFDRAVFRRLMGWATAWSFDRLRLWLEEGVAPTKAARQAAIHVIARWGLAIVFAYHGLVPKILGSNADELQMLRAAGISDSLAGSALLVAGVAEVILAAGLIGFWLERWPDLLVGSFAILSTTVVALASPNYLGGAFNPVTLNLALACLAAIDLLSLDGVPSARRSRRRPPRQGAP